MNRRKLTKLESKKTPAMRVIELEYGKSIEELIKEGSVRDAGARLGVSGAVISLWRIRLGMGEKRREVS